MPILSLQSLSILDDIFILAKLKQNSPQDLSKQSKVVQLAIQTFKNMVASLNTGQTGPKGCGYKHPRHVYAGRALWMLSAVPGCERHMPDFFYSS